MQWSRVYEREKPDLVNHFTPKGVIYGSLAAKMAGVRRIYNTITGLGAVFADDSRKMMQFAAIWLYRFCLANTTILWQNKDDQAFFREQHIGPPDRGHLIRGSGVDAGKFRHRPEPEGTAVVMLPSRFVEEKGIRQFVEAARILKSRNVDAKFVLVGRPEVDQPTSIPVAEITGWMSAGLIQWWGWHDHMERIYPLAHIVCLPSYYREGVPKSLLEAAACGRPLVATDVPGCREIVIVGKNGLLVPPKEPVALANAIERLVRDQALRREMGKAGRQLILERFSMQIIASAYIAAYHL